MNLVRIQKPSQEMILDLLRDGGWPCKDPLGSYLREGSQLLEQFRWQAVLNLPIQAWEALRLTRWRATYMQMETTLWPEGLTEDQELKVWSARVALFEARRELGEARWLLPEPLSMGEIPGLLTGSIESLTMATPFVIERYMLRPDEVDLVCQVIDLVRPKLAYPGKLDGLFILSSTSCRTWASGSLSSAQRESSEQKSSPSILLSSTSSTEERPLPAS